MGLRWFLRVTFFFFFFFSSFSLSSLPPFFPVHFPPFFLFSFPFFFHFNFPFLFSHSFSLIHSFSFLSTSFSPLFILSSLFPLPFIPVFLRSFTVFLIFLFSTCKYYLPPQSYATHPWVWLKSLALFKFSG